MLAQAFRHSVLQPLAFLLASLSARRSGQVAFKVLGSNMEPTLHPGQLGLIEPLTPPLTPVSRGVVVAYRSAKHAGVLVASRVVATAGESVELRDGDLLVDNHVVPQPYLQHGRAEQEYSRNFARMVVPDSSVFVLGDFRDMSEDSRMLGPVPLAMVVGRVVTARSLMGSQSSRAVL